MKCEWFVVDKPCNIDDDTVQLVAIKRYSGAEEKKNLCKKHAAEFIGHAHYLWETDRMADACEKIREENKKKREAPNLFNQ